MNIETTVHFRDGSKHTVYTHAHVAVESGFAIFQTHGMILYYATDTIASIQEIER